MNATDDNDNNSTTLPHRWSNVPSLDDVWTHVLSPRLSSYTIESVQTKFAGQIDIDKMTEHFRSTFRHYFTMKDLRNTIAHKMGHDTAHRLLQIIHLRLADPTKNPPLHIFTYGGSVVAGSDSYWNDWWLPNTTIGNKRKQSAPFVWTLPWPFRLEDVWNDVIFGGREVVQVHNLGTRGASTEMGVLSLEYGMFGDIRDKITGKAVVPDVIIHAYGNNDILQYRTDESMYEQHRQFVEAARKLRCNEDHLPAVVFFDDHIGLDDKIKQDGHYVSLRIFRSISQLSSWHDLLAVSFPNAFRHVHYADSTRMRLGVGDYIHPGLLYHYGVAPWLLTYGILSGFLDTCRDDQLPSRPDRPEDMSVPHIPPLKEDQYRVPPFTETWSNYTVEAKERCASSSDTSQSMASMCVSSSWIANHVGGIVDPKDILSKMDAMNLTGNNGWSISGRKYGITPAAWDARRGGATFTITVSNPTGMYLELVLISLVSYGESWERARLRITARHPDNNANLGTFDVGAAHKLPTSISSKHKFEFDPSTFRPGSPIEVRFDLIGGRVFTIRGILFCSNAS